MRKKYEYIILRMVTMNGRMELDSTIINKYKQQSRAMGK